MPPGSNLVDFNRGFSYIISSKLIVEGQKIYRHGVIYYDFLLNFLKYTLVFLVVAFYNILSASQYRRVLVGIANKIALARVPTAC